MGWITVATAIVIVAAACSLSSPSSLPTTNATPNEAPDVIHLAFVADMQAPDPDVFYENEGIAVVTSTYEGLLRYLPNSTTVEPALAQSWRVAPDGLTYTFTMRQGVRFHDGTLMDSAAAKASFMRRTAINSAPAYMLAAVTGYDTPDPLTFVIHLSKPISAFLDYMASPYGPKLESPTALTAHAGTDMAQTWLQTHDVGTGPFQISEFVPGNHYLLQRNEAYWGPAPLVRQVSISIVPDVNTQQQQLQAGQLQMILHGLSLPAMTTLTADKHFQVLAFPTEWKSMLFVNPNTGIFRDPALRAALRSDVNKAQIVTQVYGTAATVSTQMYPVGMLPTGYAMDTPKYDPTLLAAAVSNLPTKDVTIVYANDDLRNQLVANLIQSELQMAGLNAVVRGMAVSQTADLPNRPDQAPDLLVATVKPDSSAPDSFGRPFFHSYGGGSGSLNFLLGSVPAADSAMDQGLAATDNQAAPFDNGKAGDLYAASGDWITIADVKDVVASRIGYVNFVHQASVVDTVRFGDLKLGD